MARTYKDSRRLTVDERQVRKKSEAKSVKRNRRAKKLALSLTEVA